ncbi:MAG: hypothetical protein WC705_03105 [Candidatus Paceibacterota bacterium]|jgi:hypothetical protein
MQIPWLDELVEKAGQTPASDGLPPVKEGEKVIGKIPDYLATILRVMSFIVAEIESLTAETASLGGASFFRRSYIKIQRNRRQFRTLNDFFWTSLRTELDSTATELGIREGNVVVAIPPRPPDEQPTIDDATMIIWAPWAHEL